MEVLNLLIPMLVGMSLSVVNRDASVLKIFMHRRSSSRAE
jgi:hypothetical protein